MTIYADIRTLLVAGLVLFLFKTGRTYPLPLHRKTYSSEKQLIITRKPCYDSIGNVGVCMFKYDCIRQKGATLSTCVDGFLFGACCLLKENPLPKITDAPFEKENEFTFQKQSNIIPEVDDILPNADFFNLSKYSSSEDEMSSTNFFTSHTEANVKVTTYTTAASFLNSFDEQETTIRLKENNNNVTHFNAPSVNITNENHKIVEYDKEENNKNYNSPKPIDIINYVSSTIKENYYENESTDNVNIFNKTIFSSSETKLYNSSEPSKDIHYNWKQSANPSYDSTIVSTDNWWLTTNKLSISNINEKYDETEPIGRIPETSIDFSSKNDTNQSIADSKISATTHNEQKGTTQMEKFEVMTSTPPDEKKNSELPYSNFTNFSEEITKRLTTHHYEAPKINQMSNITLYVVNVTEAPTINSEKSPTRAFTISQGDDAITSTEVVSNVEVLDEKSFTIYNVPATYSTDKHKKSTIPTFPKDNNLPDQSVSSLDDTTRIITQVLPTISQWSAQPPLPESFQSLVAQLSSGEIPSPITSQFDSNSHTLQPIDESLKSEQNQLSEHIASHSESVSNINISEEFYDANNHNNESDSSNENNTYSSMVPTSLSMDNEQTGDVSGLNNNDKIVSYANSYTSIDDQFSHAFKGDNHSNFETTVHSDEYHYPISNTQGEDEKSHQSENKLPDLQSETSTVLEGLSVEPLLNISDYTTIQIKSQEEYANTSTVDSFDLKYNNSTSHISSAFNFSNESILSNNTELGNEWLGTTEYDQIMKVPEIINNHSNKSTFIKGTTNIDDTIDLSPVSTAQFSLLNYTTLVTVSTPYISMSHSVLENLEKTTVSAQDDAFSSPNTGGSNENTNFLVTDASVTESSTSQNFPSEFTSLFMNLPTINETSTTNNSTSPLDSSHELVEIADFLEMNSNGSKFTDIADENDTPSKIHENSHDFMTPSKVNFTVFKDDLDKVYENTSSVSISFSGNIDPDQFNKMNFSVNHVSDIEFALNYDKDTNSFLSNDSSLTHSVTSGITTDLVSLNESFFLNDLETSTVITSTYGISQKEDTTTSIAYTESTKLSLSTYSNESLTTTVTETNFEGVVENSTFSTDNFSMQTFAETYSDAYITNVTFIASDASVAETTHIHDITLTSQNTSVLVETATHSSIPTKESEPSAVPLPVLTTPNTKWDYRKDCGVRLMQPIGRIVGGKNTYFGKWPWQALVKEATWLGLFLKNKCGGVLITAKYVLTAAHCQPGFFASLLVVLGTHDLAETFDNKASVIRNVKRMVVHRRYNPQTFENDLALLEMETPVEFSPYVVPICLPFRKEDFTSKMAFVTGWGKLTHGGDVPNILQEVQVPIVANGDCQRMFFHAGHQKAIRSNFVCAGYTNGGQDSCEGDSGGPLMVQREDNRWVLVGTVSHGIGCADPNLPGVYMRMSSYRPWIDSIINKHR